MLHYTQECGYKKSENKAPIRSRDQLAGDVGAGGMIVRISNLSCAAIAAALLYVFLTSSAVSAATLVEVAGVGGTNGDATPQFPDRSSAVASFTLDADYTAVEFMPEFVCLSCTVDFYLTRSIGPSSPIGDLVAVAPSVTNNTTPVFSGLDLTAGEYFVTAFVADRIFLWVASSAPAITTSYGVQNGLDYFSPSGLLSYPPRSDFTEFTAGSFHYRLSGQLLNVPLPAAGVLFPLGLLMLLGFKRRPR
jgi:hypothetical protein